MYLEDMKNFPLSSRYRAKFYRRIVTNGACFIFPLAMPYEVFAIICSLKIRQSSGPATSATKVWNTF